MLLRGRQSLWKYVGCTGPFQHKADPTRGGDSLLGQLWGRCSYSLWHTPLMCVQRPVEVGPAAHVVFTDELRANGFGLGKVCFGHVRDRQANRFDFQQHPYLEHLRQFRFRNARNQRTTVALKIHQAFGNQAVRISYTKRCQPYRLPPQGSDLACRQCILIFAGCPCGGPGVDFLQRFGLDIVLHALGNLLVDQRLLLWRQGVVLVLGHA